MVSLKTMKTSSGKVRKRQANETKRRKLRGTVVKMLAVMETNSKTSKDPVKEFLVTGRTGRRNAMADILGPHASVSSGDLPERLENLTTNDPEAGPSKDAETYKSEKKDVEMTEYKISGTSPSEEKVLKKNAEEKS